MIIDNRYYRIKSIFGYRLRALVKGRLELFQKFIDNGTDGRPLDFY